MSHRCLLLPRFRVSFAVTALRPELWKGLVGSQQEAGSSAEGGSAWSAGAAASLPTLLLEPRKVALFKVLLSLLLSFREYFSEDVSVKYMRDSWKTREEISLNLGGIGYSAGMPQFPQASFSPSGYKQ